MFLKYIHIIPPIISYLILLLIFIIILIICIYNFNDGDQYKLGLIIASLFILFSINGIYRNRNNTDMKITSKGLEFTDNTRNRFHMDKGKKIDTEDEKAVIYLNRKNYYFPTLSLPSLSSLFK